MPRDDKASVLNLIFFFFSVFDDSSGDDDSPGVCLSLCLNILSFDAPLQLCIYKVVTLVYLTDAGQTVFANNSFFKKRKKKHVLNHMGEAGEREKCFIHQNLK